ncbi:MAG: discoidin domain-containing protein [Clostridium perfringens]
MKNLNILLTYDKDVLDLMGELVGTNGFKIVSSEEKEPGKISVKLEFSEENKGFNGSGKILEGKFIPKKKIQSTNIIVGNVNVLSGIHGEDILDNISSTLKVLPKNLALNKPSTASSNEPSREANKGNDGDESSRWCASSENSNQWWQVDLGDIYDIEGISVKWEKEAAYGFSILVSEDGQSWKEVYNNSDNLVAKQLSEINLEENNVRYVKLQINTLPSNNIWASFFELKIFGEKTAFESFKKELDILINEGKNKVENSVEGFEIGNYHKGSKKDLLESLKSIEDIYNNSSDLEEILNSIDSLKNALELFNKRIINEYTGDINEDKKLDLGDLAIVSKYLGTVDNSNKLSIKSDINLDEEVNNYDIEFISYKILN